MSSEYPTVREEPRRFQGIVRRLFRNENAVLAIVLGGIIGIFGVTTNGKSVAIQNMINVVVQSSIRGVASVGQAMVILTAGIDLSVGGVGLICSAIGATLITQRPDLSIVSQPYPMLLAVLVMLVLGLGIGVANGLAVSRIGMPSLIVTLAIWQITKGAAFRVTGGRSITALPESFEFFADPLAGVPVPIIIFISVAFVGYFVLNHTTFGRSIYAVGGNPIASLLSGINVNRVRTTVFIISGFLASLAGIIAASRTMSASMRSMEGLELDSIAAVSVGGISLAGGKGSLIGVCFGVIIIGVINNAMSLLGADPALQGVVKGVIIFLAVGIDCMRRGRGL